MQLHRHLHLQPSERPVLEWVTAVHLPAYIHNFTKRCSSFYSINYWIHYVLCLIAKRLSKQVKCFSHFLIVSSFPELLHSRYLELLCSFINSQYIYRLFLSYFIRVHSYYNRISFFDFPLRLVCSLGYLSLYVTTLYCLKHASHLLYFVEVFIGSFFKSPSQPLDII